ncbi:MAG: hypothetical protein ACFFDF_07525 [Candidatus Odinarchaeota archaeon]
MAEERGKMTPTKLVLFIAMLLIFAQAMLYFYAAVVLPINILYGILCLVFVFIIFVSLDLIGLGPIKIPYWWWLMLIIGVLMILFDYLTGIAVYGLLYFTGTLVILAVLMELVGGKMKLEGCKFMVFFGVLFGIWDCITIFIGYTAGGELGLVNGIFGLILMIILLILVFNFFDIKIPYIWWVLLIIAFVMYTFVDIYAGGYPVTGFSGTILMIAFVCHIYFK